MRRRRAARRRAAGGGGRAAGGRTARIHRCLRSSFADGRFLGSIWRQSETNSQKAADQRSPLSVGGAAVGMTPFCQDAPNEATMGFRFWADGYWKGHLGGRPYHISALFVVDLHKFRRRGYGDQYRIFYDSLSKDPNSLANLDQDLPNYAQHVVPIHSLPEAWLWCETWCGRT